MSCYFFMSQVSFFSGKSELVLLLRRRTNIYIVEKFETLRNERKCEQSIVVA